MSLAAPPEKIEYALVIHKYNKRLVGRFAASHPFQNNFLSS
jgi:hypothetical protein